MSSAENFWTDVQQATERLRHCVVSYDGVPYYVRNVLDGRDFDDRCTRAVLQACDSRGDESRKKLNSPKFKRFRELPELGWFNYEGDRFGAVLLTRRAVTTRVHGLSTNNVVCTAPVNNAQGTPLLKSTGDTGFTEFIFNDGFQNIHKKAYPSLLATLNNIVEGSAIAVSNKFCVIRDGKGIRWLYRNEAIVGLFTGADTLNLLSRHGFLREEIMADEVFATITTIREF